MVTFKCEYLDTDNSPNRIVKSEVQVSIDEPDKFVNEMVKPVMDKYSADDLKQIVEMGFDGLGAPVYRVPDYYESRLDSLENELNAWIVAAASVGLWANGSANSLESIMSEGDKDFQMGTGPLMGKKESLALQANVVDSEYGSISIVTYYDYENVPKGLIESF